MSFAAYKRQFKADQSVNPETGRSITIGGEKYKELAKKYGVKSPAKAKRASPAKQAPAPRSPRAAQSVAKAVATRGRSPVRNIRSTLKDPFEVLSDESIMKVLHKLSDENRLLWANASPKVRSIYNKMNM